MTAKRLSMVTEESFSNFSPIREEPDVENSPFETPKIYNLRPKRISFSSTPKKPHAIRYASCSNLAELDSKFEMRSTKSLKKYIKSGIERSRANWEQNIAFLIIVNKNKNSSRRVSKHFLSILISIMVNRWLQVILLVPEKSICINLIFIIVLQYSFQNLLKVSTRLFVLSGQKSDFGFLRESTKIISVPNIKYFLLVSVDILATLGNRVPIWFLRIL